MIIKWYFQNKFSISFESLCDDSMFRAPLTLILGEEDFVTTVGAVNEKREKIFDYSSTSQSSKILSETEHYKMESAVKGYATSYDKWTLLSMCSEGKKYKYPTNDDYNYKEEMTKDTGFMRLFPFKLSTWGETRYDF